jgi:ribose 5-phosphate isomerase A
LLPDKGLIVHHILHRLESRNGGAEFRERADEPVWIKCRDRHLRIAEIDRNDRNIGRPGGADIGDRIPHHDGALWVAAGLQYGRAENARIGLLHCKSILAADRGKTVAELHGVQKAFRQPFKLIGADREPMARVREPIQRRFEPGKRLGAVGDVFGIMRHEGRIEGIHIGARGAAALQDQSLLDHAAGAAADQGAGFLVRDRGQSVSGEGEVERIDQVGGRVDQRAVEVEYDGEHGFLLAGEGERRKKSSPSFSEGLGKIGGRIPLAAVLPYTRAMDVDALKRAASARALDFVLPGMRLGLGTGSTARHFVDLLGERVAAGLDVIAVPTSEATRSQAQRLGIKLTTLDEMPALDLTVDGADEVAPDFTLIKGGGGALLREKIVATASARMIVIVDESKYVPVLGHFPLPIEIAPFGAVATHRAVDAAIAAAGCSGPAVLRKKKDEQTFVTDGGHWILDAHLRVIPDPRELAVRLSAVPGVMEHGLFIGNAQTVILAAADGVRLIERR